MSAEDLVLGIDLGGTKFRIGIVTHRGELIDARTWPTHGEEGPDAIVRRIVAGAEELLGRHSVPRAALRWAGIGAPGPMNDRTGIVSVMPNLPGWEQFPLRDRLSDGLGVPVRIGNDGNLAALGEHRYGAGRGVRDMVLLALGTGVGGGIIVNNELCDGATGAAGEVGHIILNPDGPVCNCGRRGCLEAYCSGHGLERLAEAVVQSGRPTLMAAYASQEAVTVNPRIIQRAAADGDAAAGELLAQAAKYLGWGMVSLIHIFNPELVVFGGGLVGLKDAVIEPAIALAREQVFAQHREGLRFAYAVLGDDLVVMGAAALAIEAGHK